MAGPGPPGFWSWAALLLIATTASVTAKDIELEDGSLPHEGRVEVEYDWSWGTVCDDGFDMNDAHVICRQLGYKSAEEVRSQAAFGEGSGKIVLDDLACEGSETNIEDCSHNGWGIHDCQHSEDVGVVCTVLGCEDPLGVKPPDSPGGRSIPDSSITASSSLPDHPPHAGRLDSNSYWAAGQNIVGEWLQVDLGVAARVTGTIIQGSSSGSWITSYKLQYSEDGTSWTTYVGSDGSEKIFAGNTDDSTAVTNELENPVYARYVRFVVQEWNGAITMRAEVTGCTGCNSDPLGVADSTIPDGSITASSALPDNPPHAGRLDSNSYWAASQNRIGEWLQVDLGKRTRVTGTIIQGSSSGSWITFYKLQYSDDGTRWTTYVGSDGSDKIFAGNTDASTAVTNELENPVKARYVRFVVQEWNGAITMRFDVAGCTDPVLSGLTLDDVGMDHLSVSWTISRDAYVSLYSLSYRQDGSGSYQELDPAPATDAESATVSGLQADTDYHLVLYTTGVLTGVTFGTYRTAPRLAGLTLDDAGINSLTVDWTVIGNLPTSRYSLRYELAGGSDSHQELDPAPGVGDTSATVSGLLAYTEYTLTLTSYDQDDVTSAEISGTYKTEPAISDLEVESYAYTDLKVSWTKEAGAQIDSYSLSYELADGTGTSEDLNPAPAAGATSATVSGLLIYKSYTITLTSFDDQGRENGVIVGTFRTESPIYFDDRDQGPTSVEVFWQTSDDLQIGSYILSYEPADGSGTSEDLDPAPTDGDFSAKVTGLLPYTSYTITLTYFDDDNQRSGFIIYSGLRTKSVISGLTLERAGVDDLEVSWTKDPDFQIDSYTLSYEPADGTGTPAELTPAPAADATSATVPGLLPYTRYIHHAHFF
uniref:Uncharacterized protein n=1 Tax=Branchiostoma floridae TaxID=7739 RepID=C3YP34_BRAFL|eukprot:XP_002601913.1 hypothetical protein BRAFLDRAFT_86397 [Branchiostoma floridae]